MAEADSPADEESFCSLGQVEVLRSEAQFRARSPEQPRISGRVGGRRQQEEAGGLWEGFELCDHALLDAALQWHRAGEREAAGNFGGAQGSWELAEREWIAPRFCDELIAHTHVDWSWDRELEQLACVVVSESLDDELRQTSELLVDCAHRERDHDSFRVEAAGNEGDCLRRVLVEPLGVVHDAEKWSCFGELGE